MAIHRESIREIFDEDLAAAESEAAALRQKLAATQSEAERAEERLLVLRLARGILFPDLKNGRQNIAEPAGRF